MGKFKVGDRVRFLEDGYESQPAGHESVVVMLDDDDLAILASDPASSRDMGWPDHRLELVRAASESPTLLDQFAMAALTGLILHGGDGWSVRKEDAVAMAYQYAQAMMKAREVQK